MPPQETPEKKPRIGLLTALALVLVALIFDGGQFLVGLIPFLDIVLLPIVGITASIVFWIWFMLIDPSLMSGAKAFKNQLAMAGMSIATVIPFLDMLPEITAGVVAVILISRAEDMGLSVSDLIKTGLNIAKNPVLGTAEAVVSAKSKEREKKGGGGVGSFMANRVGGDRKAVGKPLPQDGVRRAKGYAGPTINKEPTTSKQTPLVSGGKPSPLVSEANRWR
ncbi:MAG: hypothetical protein KBC16_00895 [Candidatus Pacebacteria bacterium]|nr:hypothetical protein [Candidatus Paceibacterota bacterium]